MKFRCAYCGFSKDRKESECPKCKQLFDLFNGIGLPTLAAGTPAIKVIGPYRDYNHRKLAYYGDD